MIAMNKGTCETCVCYCHRTELVQESRGEYGYCRLGPSEVAGQVAVCVDDWCREHMTELEYRAWRANRTKAPDALARVTPEPTTSELIEAMAQAMRGKEDS